MQSKPAEIERQIGVQQRVMKRAINSAAYHHRIILSRKEDKNRCLKAAKDARERIELLTERLTDIRKDQESKGQDTMQRVQEGECGRQNVG